MNLYYVSFVAGSHEMGAIRFEGWVTANDAKHVEDVCQTQVNPLAIATFEQKTRYTNPQFILAKKTRLQSR